MGKWSGLWKTIPSEMLQLQRTEGVRYRSDDSGHNRGSCDFDGVEAGGSGYDDVVVDDGV